MQIFLDSADIKEISEINELGILAGVTTNPSLIAKTVTNFASTISQICKIIEGDVSVEVTAHDASSMIEQGTQLLKLGENIVIKLPVTWEGIKACKYFNNNNIKVNMTLCFSTNQALLAALAGATYISPFIGRLDDNGIDGIELIENIRHIYDNYPENIQTKILAASIRNPYHFHQSAMAGADYATTSGKVIKELIHHPLTVAGLELFDKDWNNSKLKI